MVGECYIIYIPKIFGKSSVRYIIDFLVRRKCGFVLIHISDN